MTHFKKILFTFALTLGVAGLALASQTIVLTNEFGGPITGANVQVQALVPPASAGAAAPPTASFQARELKDGGYAMPEISGPVVILVNGVRTKAIAVPGQNVDLIAGEQNGQAYVRVPGTQVSKAGPVQNAAGANCSSATVIPWASIQAGYNDIGSTGTTDDMPEGCYGYFPGSDGFYTFTAGTTDTVIITSCDASYYADTIITLRSGLCGGVLGCNDDDDCNPGYVYGSTLTYAVTAGSQYTIQVDNWYSTSALTFALHVSIYVPPPPIVCPTGGIPENEPNCGQSGPPPACDGVDTVDGGCNSTPPVFESVSCGQAICGTYGTCNNYYRDTDWFMTVVPPGELWVANWCCRGNGPNLIGQIQGHGCPAYYFESYTISAAGSPDACVAGFLYPGTWMWFMAPSNWNMLPCGTDYVCHLDCVTACCGGGTGGSGPSSAAAAPPLGKVSRTR